MKWFFKLLVYITVSVAAFFVAAQIMLYLQPCRVEYPVPGDATKNAVILNTGTGIIGALLKARAFMEKQNDLFIWLERVMVISSDENYLYIRFVSRKRSRFGRLVPNYVETIITDMSTGSTRIDGRSAQSEAWFMRKQYKLAKIALAATDANDEEWDKYAVILFDPGSKQHRDWYTALTGTGRGVVTDSPEQWEAVVVPKTVFQKRQIEYPERHVFISDKSMRMVMNIVATKTPQY